MTFGLSTYLFILILFFSNQGSAFDFGGLEEAIVLQGMKIRDDHHESKACMIILIPYILIMIFNFLFW